MFPFGGFNSEVVDLRITLDAQLAVLAQLHTQLATYIARETQHLNNK